MTKYFKTFEKTFHSLGRNFLKIAWLEFLFLFLFLIIVAGANQLMKTESLLLLTIITVVSFVLLLLNYSIIKSKQYSIILKKKTDTFRFTLFNLLWWVFGGALVIILMLMAYVINAAGRTITNLFKWSLFMIFILMLAILAVLYIKMISNITFFAKKSILKTAMKLHYFIVPLIFYLVLIITIYATARLLPPTVNLTLQILAYIIVSSFLRIFYINLAKKI